MAKAEKEKKPADKPAKDVKPPKVSKPKNSIKITQVKILSDSVELTMIRQQNGVLSKPHKEPFDTPPHQDFRDAVAALAIHQGLIIGSIKGVSSIKNVTSEIIEDHRPTGVILKKDGSTIQITGQLRTINGKYTTHNTVPRLVEQDSSTRYIFMDELKEAVDIVIKEAQEYLGGKVGVKQAEMDFEEEAEE